MLRRYCAFLFTLAMLVVCLAVPAWAQGPVVKVGEAEGSPQSELSVDVTLSGAESANVRSVLVNIQFPKAMLTFIRTESSSRDVVVDAEVQDAKAKPGTAVVELKIAPSKTAAQQKLADGTLGKVFFTIAVSAEPETKMPLQTQARAILDDSAQAQKIEATNGTIAVVPSLIFSCFFYMH